MKKTFWLIVFVLSQISGISQQTVSISEQAFPGIESISARQFGHDGLWGYINGGADLYLEYGFEHLTVQEIRVENAVYKADIYRMSSPEAAFGIFSVYRFRCRESNQLNIPDCITPYQYLAAKGNYYISVSNPSGSENDMAICRKIATNLLDQIENIEIQRPGIFSSGFFVEDINNLKLMVGPLGLQNGFLQWDKMFSGFQDYALWVLPFQLNGVRSTMGHLKFHDQKMRTQFIEKNQVKICDPAMMTPDETTGLYGFLQNDTLLLFEGILSEPITEMLRGLINK